MTGARLPEVTQSAEEDGENHSRSIKNEASRRSVSIHRALPVVAPLFPHVKPDGINGKRSIATGTTAIVWLRDLGITNERITSNHSWRHFLVKACRAVAMQGDPQCPDGA